MTATQELSSRTIAPAFDEQLSAGLDYYKPTMSQLIYEQEPNTDVTFTFHNRGKQRLLDYIDTETLAEEFETIRQRGWSNHELQYLGNLALSDGNPVFTSDYLNHLHTSELPPVQITTGENDIGISTTGPWEMATFWETTVMSRVNERYFENYLLAHNINPTDLYDEGDRRLSEKIATLQAHPEIKFADFGTRRHFSLAWQTHVVERLLNECPENFIGTSNVGLAQEFDIKPVGTFAHEMPMVYAGLADARGESIRDSHGAFLGDWYARYGKDLSTALTDTFGSEFFFSDFTPEQAHKWHAMRHDSGDPYAFGEQLIHFYEANGINPHDKTIVFSDGLDIDEITKLHAHFSERIGVTFGWGTTLTNDLGIDPLNIVMKATHVHDREINRGADTVKLSDDIGKHTGPEALVEQYRRNIFTKVRS